MEASCGCDELCWAEGCQEGHKLFWVRYEGAKEAILIGSYENDIKVMAAYNQHLKEENNGIE